MKTEMVFLSTVVTTGFSHYFFHNLRFCADFKADFKKVMRFTLCRGPQVLKYSIRPNLLKLHCLYRAEWKIQCGYSVRRVNLVF